MTNVTIGGTMDFIGYKNWEQQYSNNFPIVGIGASAGGLKALEAFFEGLQHQFCDMTLIIVQHLSLANKSFLSEILSRYTDLEVVEALNGMTVEVNHVYVIQPKCNMEIKGNKLFLTEFNKESGFYSPIDFFFNSLANNQLSRAIGIILSGSGNDGTIGVKTIKEYGGLILAQNPSSAEYGDMPKSAIQTGLVDCVVEANEMSNVVKHFVNNGYVFIDPNGNASLDNDQYSDQMIDVILSLILKERGHDFSEYKISTIKRRIARRLMLNNINRIDKYYHYLLHSSSEMNELFDELLIGVTQFFRDKEGFEVLSSKVFPALFESKQEGDVIRVWCEGCSTGEEAYSIAILLDEYMENLNETYKVQIFASDIDKHAVTFARRGVYPISIKSEVSISRLKTYFDLNETNNTYVISKALRKMVIFSVHSIIKDPPFSKLDMVCCRNLLIYLNRVIQSKVIPLFHFALNPGGILFLGKSESIGKSDDLFEFVDHHYKIYRKKQHISNVKTDYLIKLIPPNLRNEGIKMNSMQFGQNDSVPLKNIMNRVLLMESGFVGVMVNIKGDILHVHGMVDDFFTISPGKISLNNVLVVAKEGLREKLTLAFKKLVVDHETSELLGVSFKQEGRYLSTDIRLTKAMFSETKVGEEVFIIIFKNSTIVDNDNAIVDVKDLTEKDLDQFNVLRSELKVKENSLVLMNDELMIVNSELLVSNENMQLLNEEMQSANEELETSKEELQSINEELSTVNSELQIKVNDLSQANNDINNLLSRTNIATVFLDNHLKVLRFTPSVCNLINLIESDVGRSITHLSTNFIGYNELMDDIAIVLDTLNVKKSEVVCKRGLWYEMIIQPYRTLENAVEGVMLTFVDITKIKQAKEQLTISEIKYRTLFTASRVGIIIANGDTGIIEDVNPYLLELLRFSKDELIGECIWNIGFEDDIINSKLNFDILREEEFIKFDNLPIRSKNGSRIEVEFISNVYEIGSKKIIQCNIRNS